MKYYTRKLLLNEYCERKTLNKLYTRNDMIDRNTECDSVEVKRNKGILAVYAKIIRLDIYVSKSELRFPYNRNRYCTYISRRGHILSRDEWKPMRHKRKLEER